jgi:hypothetical protein
VSALGRAAGRVILWLLPPGRRHWVVEALYLLILGCCMLVVLWATSAGTRFAGGALGLAVGLELTPGAGMYLSAPLGPQGTAAVGVWQSMNPWLPRPWLIAIVFASWALLVAGPLVVGPVAGRGELAQPRPRSQRHRRLPAEPQRGRQ